MIYNGRQYGWDDGELTPEKTRKEEILIEAKERYLAESLNPESTIYSKAIGIMFKNNLIDFDEVVQEIEIEGVEASASTLDSNVFQSNLRSNFEKALSIYLFADAPNKEAKEHIKKMKGFMKEAEEIGALSDCLDCVIPKHCLSTPDDNIIKVYEGESLININAELERTYNKEFKAIFPVIFDLLDPSVFQAGKYAKSELLKRVEWDAKNYVAIAKELGVNVAEVEELVKKSLDSILATVDKKEKQAAKMEKTRKR